MWGKFTLEHGDFHENAPAIIIFGIKTCPGTLAEVGLIVISMNVGTKSFLGECGR